MIKTPEGREMAKKKANTETLQKIENLINELSEVIVDERIEGLTGTATEMMSEIYDEMFQIFGRNDQEMRTINKMIRDIITI